MSQKIVILQASKEKPILKFELDLHVNFQKNVEVNLDQDFFEGNMNFFSFRVHTLKLK